MSLNKVLTFNDVFWAGLGYIVGAGIYSLLDITTKYGKNYTWLSFLIGGLICILTGLSYADLSSNFDSNAAEYEYITKTIDSKFKYIIGPLMILLGILATSTLMIAFTQYFNKIFKDVSYNLILTILIIITSIINIIGVKFTTNTNMLIAIIESSTLVILIALSFLNYKKWKPNKNTNDFNIDQIIHGGFLTIFTYAGFEAIAKLSNETKNSKKVLPKAIVYSLLVSIIIYTLVSFSVNKIYGTNNVLNSISALSDTYKILLGKNAQNIVNIIGLLSIFNTVMLTQLFTSRQLYGISEDLLSKKISRFFTSINKTTKTAINLILFIAIISYVISYIKNVEKTTTLTNLVNFGIFFLINLAALLLRLKKEKNINYFVKYPLHPILGMISSFYMLFIIIKNNYLRV